MGERPTPVDIGHEIHVGLELKRNAHVDELAVAQVSLGGASRSLNHHLVVVPQQAVQRFCTMGKRSTLGPLRRTPCDC